MISPRQSETRDAVSTGEKWKSSPLSLSRPLLLGKGSTFCRPCTLVADNAGDTVRTCRDYVIGCSGNVATVYIASDFLCGSASRHLQSTLSSQFTLFPLPLATPLYISMSPYRTTFTFNCVTRGGYNLGMRIISERNHNILIATEDNVTKKSSW